MLNWVANYGVPATIVSDRGSCFTSKEWTSLMTYLGCTHKVTCAYRPSSNGSVERVNRTLKVALKAQLATENWLDVLPIVLLGLRTVVRADLNATASEMVYGTQLRLPGQFFDRSVAHEPQSQDFLEQQQAYLNNFCYTLPRMPTSRPTYTDPKLQSCTHVFIRNNAHTGPLDQPWVGPYPVIKRGAKTFVVLRNGEHYTVSVDRLKAAYLMEDYCQQYVPKRAHNHDLNGYHETTNHVGTSFSRTRTRPVQPPSYQSDYVTATHLAQ